MKKFEKLFENLSDEEIIERYNDLLPDKEGLIYFMDEFNWVMTEECNATPLDVAKAVNEAQHFYEDDLYFRFNPYTYTCLLESTSRLEDFLDEDLIDNDLESKY